MVLLQITADLAILPKAVTVYHRQSIKKGLSKGPDTWDH